MAVAHAVPNSAGTSPPKFKAPANACDCHMHIYDGERFPPARPASRQQTQARVPEYRLLQARLGTTRNVVVTPAASVTDNRITLDAIAQLGAGARGVAVVHPEVSDGELSALAEGGIRGIRFSVFDPRTAATRIDMIEPLARRVNDLGWHVQLHMRADQIVEAEDLLQRLPCPLVFDHMARLPQPAGVAHPAFGIVCRLMVAGCAWVKLSGAYMDTAVGSPTYADTTQVARAYIKAAPERVVWGSDWPHPTESIKPDDAILFDLLSEWAPDAKTRERILVANPAELYRFPACG
ncbi:MAG TPA: amidohydrolase family protein [Xanthobacteraceae bacterium]|nr:amidohydrolase family protein [Xanthobacteraceae bacterium]